MTHDLPLKVMFVAGESSSDLHAAGVARELISLVPGISLFGMGGESSARAGLELIVDSAQVASVMGLVEVVGHLPQLYRAYSELIAQAEARRPQVVVLVDFPDFNFLIGKALHKRGVKVLYFVCPQVWAWRKGRVRTMQRFVDTAAVIFPFEADFYARHGVNASFVGHPFIDLPPPQTIDLQSLSSPGTFQAIDETKVPHAHIPKAPRRVVALLPGSRRAEVERLLPLQIEAFLKAQAVLGDLIAVVPRADSLDEEFLRSILPEREDVLLIPGHARELLHQADFAVVASGTATVEAALAQVPFVCVYRLSPVTYRVARVLVRGVKHFAMPNLIAEKSLVPELLQDEVTPEAMSELIVKYLSSPQLLQDMRNELRLVRERLRPKVNDNKTVYRRVGEMVLELCNIQGRV